LEGSFYDTVMNGDREERVVNQEATMAAREKQKAIKDRFRSWVFSDPTRTERLVRIYKTSQTQSTVPTDRCFSTLASNLLPWSLRS
jgi:N12 class adenine-specific DNA methylase